MRPELIVNLSTGEISGPSVQNSFRTIRDMEGYYRNEQARQNLDPRQVVYRIQAFFPHKEGENGGLFLGNTFVEPGMVGDEYFMTKGHFHRNRNRSEFYVTVAGQGALILMDEDRRTVFEPMHPGSVHYIAFNVAHRVANIGDTLLSFLACWPSDAGHDYGSIATMGFGVRLRKINGVATLVEER